MKKTVLTFGLISGAISAAMMLITIPFVDKIGFDKGEILGYATIVLSALRRRHPYYINLQRLLRRYLGNSLFQVHARLHRQIRRPHG
jgi:hypothetical protein